MKTDTPKTDKAAIRWTHVCGGTWYVSAGFSRDMERENARLREEVFRVSNDYIPENDGQAPLALQEMRDALNHILSNAAVSHAGPGTGVEKKQTSRRPGIALD